MSWLQPYDRTGRHGTTAFPSSTHPPQKASIQEKTVKLIPQHALSTYVLIDTTLGTWGPRRHKSLPRGTLRLKRREEETNDFGLSVMRRWELPTGNYKRKNYLGLTQSGGIRGILKGGGLSRCRQSTGEGEGMGVRGKRGGGGGGNVREGCLGRFGETSCFANEKGNSGGFLAEQPRDPVFT